MKKIVEYISPPLVLDIARAVKNWVRTYNIRHVIAANSEWRGRYAGRRVFVIGNGPSLSTFDRLLLRGEKVIVMNAFNKATWKDEVDIVAHCIAEHRLAAAWNAADIRASIEGTQSASYWLDISSYAQIDGIDPAKQLYYVLPVFEPALWRGRRVDLQAPTISYQTTAQLAIQVAIHMGFKEVLLIGFDHDWLASPDYSRHFFSMDKETCDVLGQHTYLEIIEFMRRMWSIYYAMRQVTEAMGIKIVNLSAVTLLDVFERQDASIYLEASPNASQQFVNG